SVSTLAYTLSLHDALPICFYSRRRTALALSKSRSQFDGSQDTSHEDAGTGADSWTAHVPHHERRCAGIGACPRIFMTCILRTIRSEEHTSELQSHLNLVCR